MARFEIVSRFDSDTINLPRRATAFAAGYDFEVAEDIIVPPFNSLYEKTPSLYLGCTYQLDQTPPFKRPKYTLVPTGIKCWLDQDQYLELSIRSSLPLKYQLVLANGVGIIDRDYYNNPDNEGEIFFQVLNLSPFGIYLKKGDRIGQGIIKNYKLVDNDYYGKGSQRMGGFGSTSNAPLPLEPSPDKEWTWHEEDPILPHYTTKTEIK